jgi:hypothetical protein
MKLESSGTTISVETVPTEDYQHTIPAPGFGVVTYGEGKTVRVNADAADAQRVSVYRSDGSLQGIMSAPIVSGGSVGWAGAHPKNWRPKPGEPGKPMKPGHFQQHVINNLPPPRRP